MFLTFQYAKAFPYNPTFAVSLPEIHSSNAGHSVRIFLSVSLSLSLSLCQILRKNNARKMNRFAHSTEACFIPERKCQSLLPGGSDDSLQKWHSNRFIFQQVHYFFNRSINNPAGKLLQKRDL